MLKVTELRKTYGEVVAVDGVSLTASPGRLVGFLGPNGAGKTTTMRSIFGLLHLDGGDVTWHGRPIDADRRLGFGYMPEQRGLYPRMPILRQLVYFARMHGIDRPQAERAGRVWLDRLGLGERLDDPLDDLSHGNQQRVQLAAALVHDPALLVLDEPFSGLDPLGVQAMSEVLRERAREGTTVVFSSHQLELVEELCDDVVIIANGRTRLEGTLDEARAAASYRNVNIRLEGGRPVPPPPGAELIDADGGIVRLRVPVATDARALVEHLPADAVIEHLTFTAPRLTEVFRDVVGASLAQIEAEQAAREDQRASEVQA